MMISVFDREDNIVGKGENASYHHFLFVPQSFQKASLFGSLTHYQMTNFRLFQIERVCRRQFLI